MTAWFGGLPIHRKLTVSALAISGVSLLVALSGLIVIDIWRARALVADETASLARVIAQNIEASVIFDEPAAAREILQSVRVRAAIERACVYLPDGALFAGYGRSADLTCPRVRTDAWTWRIVSSAAPIERHGRRVGEVVLEGDLSDIERRVALTLATGLGMLLCASVIALALAQRMQRAISQPIVELAAAARRVAGDHPMSMPDMSIPHDEVGELIRAFGAMVDRVRQSTATLVESNQALQNEIEERRRVEGEREALLRREREASRLKDEFLATVSHELRTPLNAILGWSHVLLMTPPDPTRVAKAVTTIARNATAQARVVEDLLDISRIATGKLRLAMRAVDLRTVVDAAIDAVRPAAQVRGIGIDCEAEPAAAFRVHGDPERLQQVVWNLLSNAIKFTPAGGRVGVHLGHERERCVIRVIDHGSGIDPAFLPHVFERFRQADGSFTRPHGGLGLGLAIVKEIAEAHGGTVEVSSAGAGRGAEFSVRLPRLSPGAAAAEHGARPVSPPSLSGIRVLAVDDNLDALEVLVEVLTTAEAQVSIARSGSEAVEVWKRAPADVLLCDLAMPGMDGFELLRRIRAMAAASGDFIPAVAVTAHASEAHQARSAREGFQAYLAKPYSPAALIEVIAQAVEAR